jgi:hypothetical protein
MPTLDDLKLNMGDFILDSWYLDLVEYLGEHDVTGVLDGYGNVRANMVPISDLAISLGVPTMDFSDIFVGNIHEVAPIVPSNASDTGNAGDIAWDSDYIYVCVDTNTWKRVAIATWP